MAKKKRRKKLKKKKKKFKKKKTKKRVKRIKKSRKTSNTKNYKSNELIFKVPKKWARSAYIDRKQYEKNINYQLKITKVFGKKKEKELIGLNHTKK